MGYGAFYIICPRASSQYVTPLLPGWALRRGSLSSAFWRQYPLPPAEKWQPVLNCLTFRWVWTKSPACFARRCWSEVCSTVPCHRGTPSAFQQRSRWRYQLVPTHSASNWDRVLLALHLAPSHSNNCTTNIRQMYYNVFTIIFKVFKQFPSVLAFSMWLMLDCASHIIHFTSCVHRHYLVKLQKSKLWYNCVM